MMSTIETAEALSDSKNYEGVVLRVRDGGYLRCTGSDWGPSHLPGRLVDAVVFDECTERISLEEAERAWGVGVTRVPVRVTRIVDLLEVAPEPQRTKSAKNRRYR